MGVETEKHQKSGLSLGRSGLPTWWPTLIVVGLFILVAVPMILAQHSRGRGRFDQINYHEPAILRFAEQLPNPDISDYLSATTPAYHLVLASVARYISPSLIALQLVGSLFTIGLLVVLTRWLALRTGAVTATLLGLTVLCSLYVFSAGVYLLPDNAAWFSVVGILLLALRPRVDRWTYLGGGIILLLLVLTRQSHLWAMGVLWVAAWLGSSFSPRSGGFGEIAGLLTQPSKRIGRLGLMLICCIPALLALGWFVRIWGGLTVPIFQSYMKGPNPATPAIILAQFGVIGAFHIGFWWRSAVDLVRTRPGLCVGVLLIGIGILLIPETTFDKDAGRYSGLWNLTAKAPDVGGHVNLGVFILGIGGLIAVSGWLAGLDARRRWVMFGSVVAFAAAASMPKNAWTRYHEPMLLIWAALASAMLSRPTDGGAWRLVRWAGLAGLCAALAGVTALKLMGSAPVEIPKESQPSIERPLRELWPADWGRVNARQPEGGDESD